MSPKKRKHAFTSPKKQPTAPIKQQARLEVRPSSAAEPVEESTTFICPVRLEGDSTTEKEVFRAICKEIECSDDADDEADEIMEFIPGVEILNQKVSDVDGIFEISGMRIGTGAPAMVTKARRKTFPDVSDIEEYDAMCQQSGVENEMTKLRLYISNSLQTLQDQVAELSGERERRMNTIHIIEEHEAILDLHHECIATITSAVNEHHVGIRQLAGGQGKGGSDPWKAFLSKYIHENDELKVDIIRKEQYIQSLEERLSDCEKHRELESERLYGEPVSSSSEESDGSADDIEDTPIDIDSNLVANIVDKHTQLSLFQWIGSMFTH